MEERLLYSMPSMGQMLKQSVPGEEYRKEARDGREAVGQEVEVQAAQAVVAGTGSLLEGIPVRDEDTMTDMSETATVNLIGVSTDSIDVGARVQPQVAVEAVASVAVEVHELGQMMLITDALAACLPVPKSCLQD